jgi:hypothetical protein
LSLPNLAAFFVPHKRYKLRTHMITQLRNYFSLFAIVLFASTQSHAQTQPNNASFETPALSNNGTLASPVGASWTFAGNAGLVRAATGQFVGSQYAYLSNSGTTASRGSATQMVNFPTAGQFHLRFLAGRNNATANSVGVSVGGAVVDVGVSPRNRGTATLESWWTQPFTIAAPGNYEIKFEQTSTTSGSIVYLDQVTVGSLPNTFQNGSFESVTAISGAPSSFQAPGWTIPSTGAYSYARTGTAGTGVAGAYVLRLSPSAPVSTTVNSVGGTYSISYRGVGETSDCSIQVASVVGATVTLLATLRTLATSDYLPYTSASFSLPSGTTELRFSTDVCVSRIDSLILNRAGPTFTNDSFEVPALPISVPGGASQGEISINPAGTSWTFTSSQANPTMGIKTNPDSTTWPGALKTNFGVQHAHFGTATIAKMAQSVSLPAGTYIAVAQLGGFNVNVGVSSGGGIASLPMRADGNGFSELFSEPFTVAAGGTTEIAFHATAASNSSVAIDTPRIVQIGGNLLPATSIALRVNGLTAPPTIATGSTLEVVATASDADGLARLRVLRNGVALAPENTAVAPFRQ